MIRADVNCGGGRRCAEVGQSYVDKVKTKRIRRDPDTTRTLILDAAESIMVVDGYSAVTSRRVAAKVGLNGATIHYYYPTTDDLFLALHKRMTDRQVGELESVLAAPDTLAALWTYLCSGTHSALGIEFIALANHRKPLHAVLAERAEKARELQAKALERVAGDLAVDPTILPPIALATLLLAVARTLTNEERVGITCGHPEVRNFVTWALANLPKASGTMEPRS